MSVSPRSPPPTARHSAQPLSSRRQQWSAHRPLPPHRSYATKRPPGQLGPTHIDAELSWRPPPVHTHSTQHQRSARTHAAALQTHAWKPERNPQRLTEQLVRVFVQRPCLCTGACGALVALVGRREGAPVGVSGVAKVRGPDQNTSPPGIWKRAVWTRKSGSMEGNNLAR